MENIIYFEDAFNFHFLLKSSQNRIKIFEKVKDAIEKNKQRPKHLELIMVNKNSALQILARAKFLVLFFLVHAYFSLVLFF